VSRQHIDNKILKAPRRRPPKFEFLALPKDMQARFIRIIELMELHGLENLGMPYVRHLQGKLWEMRAKGRTGFPDHCM